MDNGAGSDKAVDRMVIVRWSQDESMLWLERGLALLCLAIAGALRVWGR